MIERLTNKREADTQREGYERRLANGYPRNIPEERFLRLAAYEDTRLTPEEVDKLTRDWTDLCTIVGECGGISRVRVLAEADKDGRLVVLPCKVGDTVYKVFTIQAQKPVLLETQVKTLGQAADVAQLIGKKHGTGGAENG